jgi:hypothetical protein
MHIVIGGKRRAQVEELSEEEQEEERERLEAAIEVVGEMQLTAEQLKVSSMYTCRELLICFSFVLGEYLGLLDRPYVISLVGWLKEKE